MPNDLDRTILTPQERIFLEHFAFSGNKRKSLEKAGYGTALSKDQVYYRATSILRKAQKCQTWHEALSQHELTNHALAAKMQALLNCGDPAVEVNVLRLVLQTLGLLDKKAESSSHDATFVFHTTS